VGGAPLEKCVGHGSKFGTHSENSSPPLVSQTGYGPGIRSPAAIEKTSNTRFLLSQLLRAVAPIDVGYRTPAYKTFFHFAIISASNKVWLR